MEFSSLGGWVATRASGMKKNIYGNIEDLVSRTSSPWTSALVTVTNAGWLPGRRSERRVVRGGIISTLSGLLPSQLKMLETCGPVLAREEMQKQFATSIKVKQYYFMSCSFILKYIISTWKVFKLIIILKKNLHLKFDFVWISVNVNVIFFVAATLLD